MIIDRQGDLLVITDSLSSLRQQWGLAAFCLVPAGLTQIGPHAGGTPSLVFAALFGAMALLVGCRPWRRAEIDGRQREARVSNGWPWGWGHPRVIDFDDISDIDVHANRSGVGPDVYFPRLLLKSTRPKWLSLAGTTASNAENVARAVKHAILGAS